MNSFFSFLFFLSVFLSYSQHRHEVYRMEGMQYSSDERTYNVNVLIFNSNGSYQILKQQYYSKKEMKKNVILDLSIEKGTWNKKQDTLYLKNTDKNREAKFFMLNKNKIALIIEDVEISPTKWKRVKIYPPPR